MTRIQGISRLELAVVGLAALFGAALMTFAPALASETSAARRPWSSTTSANVICVLDATPQLCDPAHEHKVRVPRGTVIKVKRLRYTAADTHCSSARLHVRLNGRKIATTDWVEAGQESTVELLDDVTLRRRAQGKAHRFTYKVEGQLGGCNAGAVGSWAGDIKLSGTKRST